MEIKFLVSGTYFPLKITAQPCWRNLRSLTAHDQRSDQRAHQKWGLSFKGSANQILSPISHKVRNYYVRDEIYLLPETLFVEKCN